MVAREPNDRLAALLTEARLSRKAFARTVQGEADAHNDTVSVDHTAVGRWLAGGRARPSTVQHIVAVLSQRLGRPISAADAGLSAATNYPVELGLDYPDDPETAVQTTLQLLEGDLGEARALAAAPTNAGAWAQASLAWLVRPDHEELQARTASRRVGLVDVVGIRQTAAIFSQMDDRFGGDHARRAVAQYLRSDVEPLLRGGYTESTGRALFSAAAETLHLLAWMSYDAGSHGLAQRYFIQALRLAHAGDDALLAGSTLDAMSHQANYLGRYREAANLARAARSGTGRQATATLTAHFFAIEARALASAGDLKGTEMALSRATTLFEARNPDDDPDWIKYFDEAELSAEMGHCFRDLGNGRRAAEAARLAMTGSPRSDFFVTMVEAESLALAGDVEGACDVARTALDVGASMKSARCVQYVRSFRTRLDQNAGTSSAVRDLMDYAENNTLWLAASVDT